MSVFDEINKQTRLPKPRKPAEFQVIETSSDDDSKIINRVFKSKNPNLYNPDPLDTIGYQDNINVGPNEFEIASSILEINGGNCYSNKAIEQRWKARVNEKQCEQKKNKTEQVENRESTKKSANPTHMLYKNNSLMRNLLEKRMAELQVSSLTSSSSESGKTIENNLPINGAMLTANPDDPDIFFLRDTSTMSDVFDNSFHFEHRGTKTKVTSKKYSIHEVHDDHFIFRKK